MSKITIEGDHVWRGGEKTGWLQGNHVFAIDGKKLGYFEGNHIYNAEGHKLAYVEGDDLYSADGERESSLESIAEQVQGAVESGIQRAAVYVLLGD